MMRLLIVSLLMLQLCLDAVAQSDEKTERAASHVHHHRMGMHGMVLLTDGTDLYASHLPLYSVPHDYQIVYKVVSTHETALIAFLKAQRSHTSSDGRPHVTVLPDSFDLNRLVNGDTFSISATFFKGHFERGGLPWLEDADFRFVKQIYTRQISSFLNDEDKAENEKERTQKTPLTTSTWVTLPSTDEARPLYIYQIQHRPSFDAIVQGEQCPKPELLGTLASRTPSVRQLRTAFERCLESHILYFETADFAQ